MNWRCYRPHFVYWTVICLICFLLRPIHFPQPKIVFGSHGYFPLYDTNCASEIRMQRLPYRIELRVAIKSKNNQLIDLSNVRFGFDLFLNSKPVKTWVVDRHDLYAGRNNEGQTEVDTGIGFSEESFQGDLEVQPMSRGEYVLRVSVLSPSEKYDCITTLLSSVQHY